MSMKSIILVQGGDSFDLEQQVAKWKKDQQLCRFNGESVAVGELESALLSPSLFADTLVIIEDAHELKPKAEELVLAFHKSPGTRVQLILHATSRTELSKHLPVVEIAESKPWEKQGHTADWIRTYVEASGKKIHPQVAAQIAASGTQDRFLLQQELDKLITYALDKKEIQLEDVQAICTLAHESTVWQLTDAFLQRDSQKALKVHYLLERQEISPFLIIRQLRNVCHQALTMLSLSDQGIRNVQEYFPQLRGSLFEKNFKLAKEAGSDFLTRSLLAIDETELALKDSPFDETALLMKLFI